MKSDGLRNALKQEGSSVPRFLAAGASRMPERVATENDLHVVPFEGVADRAVAGVNGGPRPDLTLLSR